jgi:endonuclease VIII
MPEGPEVRRLADQLSAVLVDQRIESVCFAFEALTPFAGALKGRRVAAVYPRGKALLIGLEQGTTIYTHNQLYGTWRIVLRGEQPRISRQLRLALHTARHSCLLYSASDIQVLEQPQLAQHAFLNRLGPDVLAADTDLGVILDRYREKSFGRRRLGSLLLDQAFLSGLGNYLRSEILFVAGVNASLSPGQLGEPGTRSLAQATLEVTRQSYVHDGVTNDLGRYRSLRRQCATYEEARFRVFGRDGKPCYGCGAAVERLEVAGRRLYSCPQCQRKEVG